MADIKKQIDPEVLRREMQRDFEIYKKTGVDPQDPTPKVTESPESVNLRIELEKFLLILKVLNEAENDCKNMSLDEVINYLSEQTVDQDKKRAYLDLLALSHYGNSPILSPNDKFDKVNETLQNKADAILNKLAE